MPVPTAQKRIVVTGASGVGKTVLAQLLAEAASLPLVPEVARLICKEKGFESPVQITDQQAFRQDVLARQLAEENSLNKEYGAFISDRSTIDCWVMWQRWQICTAMTFDTEAYYDKCRLNSSMYTHIVYIPPMFEPSEDSFRWTEPDYIKGVDRLTRLTLFDWSLQNRTYTVKADGPENRLAEVMQWLMA